ncbi:hypothetical protein [Sphingobium yanoikuyae]|uniref:Uncharacterized protein n=1 Tax=Sphingobium yanoikuyae ATCC 51230 TaxID=883163 RepID=K9DAP6_SPHYA|nr:hypothetical protein [Sphingobium yanoikuyae]EKU74610.1 hypothetical protein HMPREF9718_02138 [Sphingobium yanoikuyae ATCC 51230]WQE06529.1 hypothetical protein U0025_19860 [Sphingobium yanoikuyae]
MIKKLRALIQTNTTKKALAAEQGASDGIDRSSPAYRLGKTIHEIGDDLAKRGAA